MADLKQQLINKYLSPVQSQGKSFTDEPDLRQGLIDKYLSVGARKAYEEEKHTAIEDIKSRVGSLEDWWKKELENTQWRSPQEITGFRADFTKRSHALTNDIRQIQYKFGRADKALSDDLDSVRGELAEMGKKTDRHREGWRSSPDGERWLRSSPDAADERAKRYSEYLHTLEAQEQENRSRRQKMAPNNRYLTGDTAPAGSTYVPGLEDNREAVGYHDTTPIRQEMAKYRRGVDGYTPKVLDDYRKIADSQAFQKYSGQRPAQTEPVRWDTAPDAVDALGYYQDVRRRGGGSKGDIMTGYLYNDTPLAYRQAMERGMKGSWDYLTDEETGIYYTILNTKGQKQANQYLDDMARVLNHRQTEAERQQQTADYGQANWAEKVGMNLASVPTQFIGSAAGFIDDAIHSIKGEDINPYSGAHSTAHYAETVRGLTAQELEEKTDGKTFLGLSAGDVYQAGMSTLDMLAGSTLGAGTYGALMGMGAASGEARKLYEMGATKEQVAAGGLLAGAAEMIFEEVSLDKLIHTKPPRSWPGLFKNILIQGGIEASEEVATELANTLTNIMVMGDESDWNHLVAESGDWKKALLPKITEIYKAGMGGFLAGGAGAGVYGSAGYAAQRNQKQQGSRILETQGGREALEQVYETAREGADPKTRKAMDRQNENLKKALAHGSAQQQAQAAGRLHQAISWAAEDQTRADLVRKGMELGDSKGQAGRYADSFLEAGGVAFHPGQIQKALNRFHAQLDSGDLRSHQGETPSLKELSRKYGSQAKAMEAAYLQGQDVRKYDLAYGLTFELGHSGVDRDYVMQNKSLGDLTDSQREIAYETGLEAARQQAQGAEHLETGDQTIAHTESGDVDVKIRDIASMDGGRMTLHLEDGSTVDAADLSFGSQDQAIVYHTVMELGLDTETANQAVRASREQQKVPEFAAGLRDAYEMGQKSYPVADLNRGMFSRMLPADLRQSVYQAGRMAAKEQVETSAATAETVPGGVYFQDGTGTPRDFRTYAQEHGMQLNPQQETGIATLEQFSAALGLDFYVYKSREEGGGRVYTNAQGQVETAPNGYYQDGRIYIDLNAGADGQGLVLFTAAHELTHWIRQWSPAKFKVLADLLMEQYARQEISVSELVARQKAKAKRNGRTIDNDTAYEEVVADSMEGILRDGKVSQFMAEVKQKDQSLWEKIKDFFRDMAGKIRDLISAYQGVKPDSREGRIVLEMKDALDSIEQAFAEGLVDAGEHQREVQKPDTRQPGPVRKKQYSLRDLNIERTFVDYGDVVKEETAVQKTVLNLVSSGKIVSLNPHDVERHSEGTNWDKKADTRTYLRDILRNFQGKTVIFSNGQEGAEAYLTKDGIGHAVAGENTPAKAAVFEKYFELIEKAQYAYSSKNDRHSNANKKIPGRIDWDCFVSVAEIDGMPYPIIFKVRSIDYDLRSQIYAIATKKETGSSRDHVLQNDLKNAVSAYGGTPVSNKIISQSSENVKEKYSDRDPELLRQNKSLAKQNEKLQEDVTYLREMLKLQKQTTDGKLFTRSSVETAARYLKKQGGVRGDTKELVELLNDFYTHIAQGEELSWESVREKAEPVAAWLEEHTPRTLDPYAQDILEQIRGTKIKLNQSQKAEAAYQWGSMQDFRKQLGGIASVSDRQGTALDSLWQEWSAAYPDIFDSEISDTDLPGALLDAISTLNGMDADTGEFAEYAHQDLIRQIYDSYWRVSTLHTVADVKQKEINVLKAKHMARMDQLRENQREQVRKLRNQYAQEKREMRQAHRAEVQEKTRAVAQRYQESRKKAVEGRNRTATRHKIQRVVDRLNSLLVHESKERHIPIGLQKAVAEALDAVNMEVSTPEQRKAQFERTLARYDRQIAEETNPEERDKLQRKRAAYLEAGDKFQVKMDHLKEAYAQIKNSEDPLIANAYHEEIDAMMQAMVAEVGDTPLREMSQKQLDRVYDCFKAISKTVQTANETFAQEKKEPIDRLASAVMTEIGGGKNLPKRKLAQAIQEFGWQNLKPVYAFEILGSETLKEVFGSVRKGEDTWAVDMTEARAFLQQKAQQYGYWNWDQEMTKEFTAASGLKFGLNLGQMMSVYAYSKRQAARDHLKIGGIVLEDSATAYNINDVTLGEIVNTLSQAQKAFVDEMQTYLSQVMGAKGNEVSLAMYDIKLFQEKNYFPIQSAPQYMAKAREQQESKAEKKLKNAGFSKATVQKANNPMVLGSFLEVWANHVNEMSMYHSFVLPLEDFYRVYNYKTRAEEDTAVRSVVAQIQNAYGKGATQYISQLLKDLNGGARIDPSANLLVRGMNTFKKGATFANLSVVVQQPSAVMRAMAILDPKYFAGKMSKSHDALWEECKHYAPVAAIKEMGYFDVNNGRSSVDFLTAKGYSGFHEKVAAFVKDSGYRDELLSKGAALADEVTWCAIWDACKRETMQRNRELNTSSEAFLKLAGERFTEVITKTQVYDSVLSRSQMMRSKDTGVKMATAFMAEPTTTMNMALDAVIQGKRGDAKYTRRVLGALVANIILNSVLKGLPNAARDDDEDETFQEKYVSAVLGGIAGDLNPLGYIPVVKDVVSIFGGYDVGRSDMSVIRDLAKAIKSLDSEKRGTWRKTEDLVGAIANLFGLPVKNLMRDARSLWQMGQTMMKDQKTTAAGLYYATMEELGADQIPDGEQLYRASRMGDEAHAQRVRERYDSEQKANQALKQAIKGHYTAGKKRISKAETVKMLVEHCGMKQKEAEALVQEWTSTVVLGIDYGDIQEAFLAGTLTSKQAADMYVRYGGYSQKEAQEKVRKMETQRDTGIAYDRIKQAYLTGNISAEKAAQMQVTYGGKEKLDAEEAVGLWNCEKDTGIAYEDIREAFVSGEITAEKAVSLRVKYGGQLENQAAETVKAWTCEKDTGIRYEDVESAYVAGTITREDAISMRTTYGDASQRDAEKTVLQWTCQKETGYRYGDIQDLYLSGDISRETVTDLYVTYGGKSPEDAQRRVDTFDFLREHPSCRDVSDKAVAQYNNHCASVGIDAEIFYDILQYYKAAESDYDANGEAVQNSKKEKVMAYIDNQDLTVEQKDALYRAFEWSARYLNRAPWH